MPEAGDDYERMGELYADHAVGGPVNAQYHRPAILALAGDVRGRRVLDAGCAAEPMPLPEVRDRDPRVWTLLTTAPRFLYLRLLRRGRP